MAVKIRLTRTGAKNSASFRVVAADSRSPRDGRFLETLGWYDPKLKGDNSSLKLNRIDHWVKEGAEVSPTVRSLIKNAGKVDAAAAVADLEAEEAAPAMPVVEEVDAEVPAVTAASVEDAVPEKEAEDKSDN